MRYAIVVDGYSSPSTHCTSPQRTQRKTSNGGEPARLGTAARSCNSLWQRRQQGPLRAGNGCGSSGIVLSTRCHNAG
jgi:hypothetical protein